MDDQARTLGAASGPALPLSVGGLFIEAPARQDFAAMAGCLDPSARLRALLLRGPLELVGPEEVAGWFRSLFGGPEGVELAEQPNAAGQQGRMPCPQRR
jgi:hypothetical protein